MAKITVEQLEIAKEWEAWGDRLGWKYLHCETGTDKSEAHALFDVGNGRSERITLLTREAIHKANRISHVKAINE